jgi:hypothetical protein
MISCLRCTLICTYGNLMSVSLQYTNSKISNGIPRLSGILEFKLQVYKLTPNLEALTSLYLPQLTLIYVYIELIKTLFTC